MIYSTYIYNIYNIYDIYIYNIIYIYTYTLEQQPSGNMAKYASFRHVLQDAASALRCYEEMKAALAACAGRRRKTDFKYDEHHSV